MDPTIRGVRSTARRPADSYLDHADVVPLAPAKYGTRYSTTELLDVERRLVSLARAQRRAGVGVVTDASSILAAYPSLSAEQAEMVRRLTTEGDGIAVVVGAADSGKTFALDAARLAWERAGHTVVGCALAARAAAELQAGAGIRSTTIASMLGELDRPGARLPPNTVLVVDEAAMVGTRLLLQLARQARGADAKLVLVGDHHQLPEIEAGGAFRSLAQRLRPVTLTNNRRQQDSIERRAVAELRDGHVYRAVERLTAHGRVVTSPTAEETRTRMVHDSCEAKRHGEDSIMLALRRDDVADLNQRARSLLQAGGTVGADELVAAERAFAVGDIVVALRNDRRIGLHNGQRGIVVAINTASRTVVVDSTGSRISVPARYLDAGLLDHAYAMTAHKAQGLTCDRAFLLGDESLYREAGYTALTRGRRENRLYAVDATTHIADFVARILERSAQQVTGLDLRALCPDPPSHDLCPEIDL